MNTTDISELSNEQLADLMGHLKVQEEQLETRRKEIAALLVERNAGKVVGQAFIANYVSGSVQWTVNRKALEAEMGEAFVTKYLKHTSRGAYYTVSPLAKAAAKVLEEVAA